MKLVSWNVNGFRAILKKGFDDIFKSFDADVFCIQESKMQEGQADFNPEGYYGFYHFAEKKGYSGTIIYTKKEPLKVLYEMNGINTNEGRVLTLEYPDYYIVNAYVPNAQPELARIEFREEFEDNMRNYLMALDKNKPIIYCGDLNVAHNPIDLKNDKANEGQPGYSIQERNKMTALLSSDFVDTFRYFYPDKEQYTWWSYRGGARSRNVGWRIDYFIASARFMPKVKDSLIYDQILGSDHCPVGLIIE